MSLSRRALLTVVAGGFLAGCESAPDPTARTVPPPTVARPTDGPARTPSPVPSSPGAVPRVTRAEMVAQYGRTKATTWGFTAPGVVTELPSAARPAIALTFDACGGPGGGGYDEALIDLLRARKVPATLFLNARWIDANRAHFEQLAGDPLFEIANHGTRHRPLSVSGRAAYGIGGTRDAGEVFDEVAGNRDKLTALLGHPPRFFRSGTAYCDDVAARIVADLGERFAGFSVNADAGATFTPAQVHRSTLTATAGSIVIGHMNHPAGGTARGMARALPEMLAAGHRFVRLSDAVH
ncbi:polysaccharide deacetylase family protein [Streptomyces sp. H10-C2]|uniref:polysaccharide deacetylase family protein n=1 Tax=unclassified Streptomyces TaxID=2593676 RepID=UPI0024BB5CE5|nr:MULTISPECIES: polysaccharide deacetylase family protein [unclassified Streptomyces]MDJ0343053.1 polysaccharide deacetylase family protein [Streptomyces sp. PH10-H1]MDJ0372767.1 polysaccharide deacetylase family protein [Streptomyces sp. H10-C2]